LRPIHSSKNIGKKNSVVGLDPSVAVHTVSGLAADLSRCDQLLQERAGAVFRIGKFVVKEIAIVTGHQIQLPTCYSALQHTPN
jgi:hypothetical protein